MEGLTTFEPFAGMSRSLAHPTVRRRVYSVPMDVNPDEVLSLLADAPSQEISLRILRELMILNQNGGTSRTVRAKSRPYDASELEAPVAAPDDMRCAPTCRGAWCASWCVVWLCDARRGAWCADDMRCAPSMCMLFCLQVPSHNCAVKAAALWRLWNSYM